MKEEETLISRLMETDLCLLHFAIPWLSPEGALTIFLYLETIWFLILGTNKTKNIIVSVDESNAKLNY